MHADNLEVKIMINILLSGACGKMGTNFTNRTAEDDEVKIICGIDFRTGNFNYPIYRSFSDVKEIPDAVVDFSNPALLDELLEFCITNNLPLIIATTGYSDEQIRKIKAAAKQIPLFFTFNMSLGINLLCRLAKYAAEILGDAFDIEIVEKHHNQKLDAPSGTAIMLANSVNDSFNNNKHYEYDRHSRRQKREKSEIGIHSVRGGTIVGEHEVIFAGHDELITLSHSAGSKEIFVTGAVKAVKFLVNKPNGLYDMDSLINSGNN